MTTSPNIVIADIEQALESLNSTLPGVLAVVGTFWPPAAIIAKFIPLLQIAITALETVSKATNVTPTQAFADVEMHLTPGQANSPVLS